MLDSGKIIRFCLVGLPVGLVLITASSMLYTEWYHPYRASKLDARGKQYAAMMRKPVSREDLEQYVRVLAKDIGERHTGKMENLRAAAYYIESSLGESNMGYQVQRQKFNAGEYEVWNLEVTVPGNGKDDGVIVIGAHYDTVPGSPGADDNASGVAALMCLANAFIGSENEVTLKFVAFVNEEKPWAKTDGMGSLVYANTLKEKGKKVRAMISLDSLAVYSDEPDSQRYPEGSSKKAPTVGNFLMLVGDESSAALANTARMGFQSGSSIPLEIVVAAQGDIQTERSDHWAFWENGYPALMMTDTGPFRYSEYHQPGDEMSQIDFDRLEQATKGIEGIIKTWANP